jgi:N-acetylneuraminate synthase
MDRIEMRSDTQTGATTRPIERSEIWPVTAHPFFIAEVGINHNGDLEIAKRLIDVAVSAGCDAVKFQKRTIDIVYTADVLAQPRQSPWGTTQRAQKEGLEFGASEYDEIDDYCTEKGIAWFASAWDIPSQSFLSTYSLRYNKVASAMLTHLTFVKAVADERKLTFVSTGMCTLEQVDEAVELFRNAGCPFVLLHTVSTYPTPAADLNLQTIVTLRQRYDVPVGYSGHEALIEPSLVAASLGATVIERHITLDRTMYGSDQAASLEPHELTLLVSRLKDLSAWMGDGKKRLMPGEASVAEKLRYWAA